MAFNTKHYISHQFSKAYHILQLRKSQDSQEARINCCPHFATKEQRNQVSGILLESNMRTDTAIKHCRK